MSWLDWARQLQALAQSGLSYEPSPYHAERYALVRRISAEMMAAGAGGDAATFEASFAAETGHATPKLDVRAAAFREKEILLVHERASGLWTLPGGWVDVGDSPAESAMREAREETGYAMRAVKLVALHDRERRSGVPTPWYIHKATFLCELLDGDAGPADDEILEVRFFAEDRLPALDLARTPPGLVELCFAHDRDRTLPSDFD
jgi:ADP-ribose pyrophosphatase YjhB (NUDIX family)